VSEAPTTVQPAVREPVRLSAHPRAARSVRRVRACAGLGALLLTLLLSLQAGVPAWDATARALVAGIAVHLVAWAIALVVWRQIVLAELRAAHERRLEARRRRAELVTGADA
jgi:hypothetical protein